MTEPTPPPERPLPDQARARIRAELLAHAHDHRSAAPRWLVPAGAAAAVALVAGLGYWAISPGGSETDGLPVTGGGTSSAAADTPATPTPTGTAHADRGHQPRRGHRRPARGPCQVGTRSCEEEMANVLEGASLALQVDEHLVVLGQGREVRALRRARRPHDGPPGPAARPRATTCRRTP